MGAGAGCLGSSLDPADQAAKETVATAYESLSEAAEALTPARFVRVERRAVRRLRREGRRDVRRARRRGIDLTVAPLKDTSFLGLVTYLSREDVFFGVAMADAANPGKVGIVLNGVEFADDPDGLTLMAAPRLGHSPPGELIEAGAMFITISETGQIYCADAGDPEGRTCPAPELPARDSGGG